MLKEKRYLVIGISLAFLTIIFDQISKFIIVEMIMQPPQHIPLTSFFDIVLVWNKGVSFGLLNSYGEIGTVMLIILALVITIGLFVWLMKATNIYLSCGLGLIIGGAIGNLIDRIYFKAVIDFLHFHVASFSWPAFNIADTAITIGVGFIILESFLIKKGD